MRGPFRKRAPIAKSAGKVGTGERLEVGLAQLGSMEPAKRSGTTKLLGPGRLKPARGDAAHEGMTEVRAREVEVKVSVHQAGVAPPAPTRNDRNSKAKQQERVQKKISNALGQVWASLTQVVRNESLSELSIAVCEEH